MPKAERITLTNLYSVQMTKAEANAVMQMIGLAMDSTRAGTAEKMGASSVANRISRMLADDDVGKILTEQATAARLAKWRRAMNAAAT